MNSVESWIEEYAKCGIPSSYRQQASSALHYFINFLDQKNILAGRAIDLGAGLGRNAFFLAKRNFQVDALDFVPTNVTSINKIAIEQNLRVRAKCANIAETWPYEEELFDIAIDVYCYKHQTDIKSQQIYRSELFRTLKPSGLFLLSLAADDDGYYAPLLTDSFDPKHKIIVDPFTNISSVLYSREEIEDQFDEEFKIVEYRHDRHIGPMHGNEYQRSTLTFIMQKTSYKVFKS